MVFSSLIFLYLFMPAAILLYFAMPKIGAKNIVLTALSLLFYAWGEPVWVVLLVFSSLSDYIVGRVIGRCRGRWPAKLALIVSLVVNFSLLGFFKYIDFFLGNINLLLHTALPMTGIALPIGISFYTFQTVSYSIDCYRDKVAVQRNFFDFLLFVSLFPQLVAGPILRYAQIEEQIRNRTHSWEAVAAGIARFTVGLAKKVLLANFAAGVATEILADPSAALASAPAADIWLGILMFTFQIYFDFSGYSDMAIGLGRIFGFNYCENFRHPYISRSITEFWRRWHISLGAFFRDYVYIPMGGNRHHHVLNILTVWLLTGLWHGASWNFVVWGLYFALLLMLEKFILNPVLRHIKAPKPIGTAVGMLYAFFFVVIGWVLFYTPDPAAFQSVDTSSPTFYLARSFDCLKALFGLGGGRFSGLQTAAYWTNNALMLAVFCVASTPLSALMSRRCAALARRRAGLTPVYGAARLVFVFGMLFLCTAKLVGASYNPFIYFRF